MKHMLYKTVSYFIDDTTGELNDRGVILAGIVLLVCLAFVGYLEAGGLLPWE